MSIIIEKVNYNNTKDIRILETVLTNWFKNPKELNLVEPRMKYPFNFKKWVTLTYKNSDIKSFALKDNKWIIGIGNIIFYEDSKYAHIMHIFIDHKYRRKGLATKIIQHLEKLAHEKKIKKITMRVMPKNKPAIKLYEKIGFKEKSIKNEDLPNSSNNNKEAINLYKKIS
mgnify:CR=1 FL=1